jgi:predicted phosphoadenosine phosphosulfate sulfurtransferase
MKKKLSRTEAKQLVVRLSWKILEHKFRYYEGAKYNLKTIPDEKYDKIESKYKRLCKALKIEPSASDMVGFNYDKPSCRLVASKLTKGLV